MTKAQAAVNAAVSANEQVVDSARRLSEAICSRPKRTRTNPFLKVRDGFDEEDSLVTSVEHMIATAKKDE